MTQEYFCVIVIYHGKLSSKIAYTKHIFNNEVEALEKLAKFQRLTKSQKGSLDWGVEPITEEDKIKVENGETVYL